MVLSGLIVATQNEAPQALVAGDFAPARAIGALCFVGLIVALYRWMLGRGRA